MAMEQNHRPLGVTIIAVLLGIVGLIELALGILAIVVINAGGDAIAAHHLGPLGAIVGGIGDVVGVLSLVIGIITLIVVWGFWTLRRWAFWLAVIVEGISLLHKIIELVRPHAGSNTSIIIGMVLPIIILVYFLLDANVRHAFRISPA